jgi:hypothetical protein
MVKFQAIAWHSGDEDDEDAVVDSPSSSQNEKYQYQNERYQKEAKIFKIYVYGRTAAGERVIVTVTDFTPHFYVLMDAAWTATKQKGVLNYILSRQKNLDLVKITQQVKKDFYGFRNNETSKFLRLDFANLRGMKIMASLLRKAVDLPNHAGSMPPGSIRCVFYCYSLLVTRYLLLFLIFCYSTGCTRTTSTP